MKPLSLKEREYRIGLLRTERRAILPIKWTILVVTALLWFTVFAGRPGPGVLTLFALYTAFNAFESYWIYFHLVTLDRIKPVTLASYLSDVIFVSMLIYFDAATFESEQLNSNFYILLYLLVMRGYALFTTVLEILLVNSLISALFILTFWLQEQTFAFVTDPEFVVDFVLIWLVVLMAWFIVIVLNQQKMDLIKTNEKLMRTSYLASVGELAAGVAHEINNPLGIITATAEYMQRAAGDETELSEEVEAIRRESNRCRDIVQQMLNYARPKQGTSAYVDPVALNDEVLQFVFPRGRTSLIELVREYDEGVGMIEADPNQIKQALLNLYLNAKQAIPKGKQGRIVSRIRRRGRGGILAFDVEDNGVGVSEEDLEHVFDPFFTRRPDGTGLGLAVTQKIVESFGGTISMEPGKESGTIVRMEFPSPSPV